MHDYVGVSGLLLPELCRLVDCLGAVLHQIDLSTAEESNVFHPAGLMGFDSVRSYSEVQTSHPFFVLAAEGDDLLGIRISDLMGRRAWHATGVYRAALRHMQTEDQMTTLISRRGPVAEGISLVTDGRPFTDRQRALLLLVRPHLRAALARTHRPGAVHELLVVGSAPAWRTTRCDAVRPPDLQPLTAAERRVLTVCATGLTRGQVARHLGVSCRTVDKHLEHVYAKLGVGNRLEAMAAVGLQVTSSGTVDGRPGSRQGLMGWSLPGCRIHAPDPGRSR